ncbi:MAG: hypothetical protein H0T46_08005 [Deltaproteobacteria bacterium]|nr:hypothetical protein [Deltaproteobacteria bacterium]
MPRFFSPTVAASIGLAILAFAAPGRARAESIDPIAAQKRPLIEDPPTFTEPSSATTTVAPDISSWKRDRDRWRNWRISGGAGVRFGSFTVNGDSTGAVIPFHLDLGARRRHTFLYGSYDVFGIDARFGAADPGDGTMRFATTTELGDGSGLVHRVGVNARRAFGSITEHDGGLEAWGEAGIGLQHIRWDAGGVWTRPDLALAVGVTGLGLGKNKHAGFGIALRVLVSRRNDTAGAMAVCGGPCDAATAPSGFDRSFLFDLSVPFGN